MLRVGTDESERVVMTWNFWRCDWPSHDDELSRRPKWRWRDDTFGSCVGWFVVWHENWKDGDIVQLENWQSSQWYFSKIEKERMVLPMPGVPMEKRCCWCQPRWGYNGKALVRVVGADAHWNITSRCMVAPRWLAPILRYSDPSHAWFVSLIWRVALIYSVGSHWCGARSWSERRESLRATRC